MDSRLILVLADSKIFLQQVRILQLMNLEDIETKLIAVLQQIQSDSGYEGQSIEGITCPINELEGFDSLLWPVAISMLEAELGRNQEIPHDMNIFFDKDNNRPFSISESAKLICKFFDSKKN